MIYYLEWIFKQDTGVFGVIKFDFDNRIEYSVLTVDCGGERVTTVKHDIGNIEDSFLYKENPNFEKWEWNILTKEQVYEKYFDYF